MTHARSLKDNTSQFYPLIEFQTETFLGQISLPPKISATEKTYKKASVIFHLIII